MAKADVVAAQLQAVQSAEAQAVSDGLSACYDQGVADQLAAGGGSGQFSQSDIDAAVKAAVDPLNAEIASDAQALSDAQAKASSDLAAVQASLDAMTQKEQLEEQAVADVAAKIAQVQASFDAIKALLAPAPVPAPDPVPAS